MASIYESFSTHRVSTKGPLTLSDPLEKFVGTSILEILFFNYCTPKTIPTDNL